MAIDNKKEQEREELHRAIWAIADELRGAVDGWDFKNYVLGTMFYRYISENLTAYVNQGEIEAGNTSFDYAQLKDEDAEEAREGLVEEKGFFILPSELFCNVRARASMDENLNETLEKVFRHIEDSAKGSQSEGSFAGLFDDYDVNSNKLGSTVAKRNERLVKLLDGVAAMNLGTVKNHDIDAFGDAYEYLMTMYASNAGKSGGEFFTPADVSELLTRLGTVGKKKVNKVYDPACGSGSLLLKAEKILGKDAVTNGFFGQEINITTYNLCRINMFLHDIGFDKFDIECEDTLINPQHWDAEPFELIVSNPPYSIKWEGDENPLLINDPRFAPAGVLAPRGKADMAFIMHSLSWLAPNGTAAIVCFPGILYRTGAEQKIRKYLIDNNYIDAIIQLPANLFFGTSIATCIMVMKKGKKDNSILFIDATDNCVKVGNNNKLTEKDRDEIVECFTNRSVKEYFSYLASYDEVVEKKYDLKVSTYVVAEDKRENIDIGALREESEELIESEIQLRELADKYISEIAGYNAESLNALAVAMGDGKVELRKLEECCNILDSKRKPVSKAAREAGDYPYYGANGIQDYVSDYIFEGTFILVGEDGSVITPEGSPVVNWAEGKIWVNNHAHIVSEIDGVLLRYLYHYLKTVNVKELIHGNIPKLNQGDFRSIAIAVPTIEVQKKIIKMMDTFNELTEVLNKEAEIRDKQYAYYRNMLLQTEE